MSRSGALTGKPLHGWAFSWFGMKNLSEMKSFVFALPFRKANSAGRYVSEDVSEHTVRVLAQLFHELTEKMLSFQVQSNCTVHGEPFSMKVDGSPAGYLQLLRYLSAVDSEPDEMLRNCVTVPNGVRLILVAPYLSEDIRRLKMEHPDADVILTSPCETGEIDFIPIYEEAESP